MAINIDKLGREGLLRSGACSGSITWRSEETERASLGFAIDVEASAGSGTLRLRSNAGEHVVDERIELEAIPQRFGGQRWYARCPITYRRCLKLILLPGGRRFAARQAWRARYASQRQGAYDRAFTQSEKLRVRIGMGDDMRRPYGLRRRTFERHLEGIYHDEEIADARLAVVAHRLFRFG